MQRRILNTTDRSMERFGDNWRFRVRFNGILFEQFCPNHQLADSIETINESFANSGRVVKHIGGYFPDDATDQEKKGALEMLSQTDTGIGIKIRQDPLKEFPRFTL